MTDFFLPGSAKEPSIKFPLRQVAMALLFLSAAALFPADPARGANETWIGGAGTWSTSGDWNSGSSWTAGGTAIFNSPAGTVTVGTETAGGLTFNVAGYTLSAGTLTLNGGSVITTTSGITTFAGSLSLAGTGGTAITVTGGGTLALSTNNSGLGTSASPAVWTITGGAYANGIFSTVLSITAGNNLGAAPSGTTVTQIFLNAGTLMVTGSDSPVLGAGRQITVNSGGGAIDDTSGSTLSGPTSGQAYESNIVDNAGSGTSLYISDASGGTITLSGTISGSGVGGITWLGPGAGVLTSTNTYTGTTTLGLAGGSNSGALQANSSNAISDAATTIYSGTLNLNNTTQTITTLSLGGGAAGTAATLATGTGGLLNLGGGVTYNAANNPNGAAISGVVNLNGNTTFTVGASTAVVNDLSVSAVLQDGAASSILTKSGAGTLDLTGANTFTGGVIINSGTLGINSGPSLGATPGSVSTQLTFAGNSALRFDASIGAGSALNYHRGILIDNGVTATFDTQGNTVYTNDGISAQSGQTGVLNKIGSGTLYLGGNNSNDQDDAYLTVVLTSGTLELNKGVSTAHAVGGGGLTINGGTAQLTGTTGDQIYNGAPVTVNAGAFDMDAESETIGSLSGSSGAVVTNSGTTASTLTVGASGYNVGTGAYAGSITDNSANGGSLALAMSGSGTLTLGGSNSYTGGTTINSGAIGIANNNALGAGTLAINNGGSLANNDTSAHTLANNMTLSGTVTYGGGSGLTLTGTLSGSSAANVVKNGASTLTINTDNSATLPANSSWTIQGGALNGATGLYSSVLAINTGKALGNSSGSTLTLNAGTLQFDANGGAGYASSRTINITSGGGAISDGGFAPGTATSGGSAINPSIVIAAGAGLNLVSSNSLYFASGGGGISGAGGVTKFGTGTVLLGGSNSYQGGTTIDAGVLEFAAADSLGSGTITLNGGTLASAQTAEVTITGAIATGATGGTIQLDNGVPTSSANEILLDTAAGQITGSGPITLTNNGLLSIGVANSGFSGNWTLNGGVLELANGNAAGTGGITVDSGGELSSLGSQISNALTLNGGVIGWDYYSNSGNYEGPISLLAGSGTVSLVNYYSGAGAINGTISGSISGVGALTTSDTGPGGTSTGGILTISGSNSYTGGTVIGVGTTIEVAGAHALGGGANPLSVAGTLDFNGYNPGVGALTLPGGGAFDYTFGTNTVEDLTVASASVSGINYIAFNSTALSGAGTYNLISSSGGGLTGAFEFAGAGDLTVPVNSLIVKSGSNSFYRLTLNNTNGAEQVVVSNNVPSTELTIMPFGSSITAGQSAVVPYDGGGYRTQLYQDLVNDGRFTPNFVGSATSLLATSPTSSNILTTANQLDNEGHPGWTTLQMLANLNMNNGDPGANGGDWLAPGNGENPNYITVNIGGNDAVNYGTTSTPLTAASHRLDAIVSEFNTLRPGVNTILSSIAYRGDGSGAYSAGLDAYYNPTINNIVFNHVLAGQSVSFLDLRNIMSYPTDIGPDLVHPTQAGYDKMANAWYQSIAYGAAYWTGSQGTVWNTVNSGSTSWDMNSSLTTDRGKSLNDPATTTDFIYPDVFFSNNSGPLYTTLGADTTIRSLNFTGGATGPVTIGAGNTLTIGSVDSSVISGSTYTLMNSGGITVQAGSGAHTVAANVILGADQTWGNVSSNPLTVSGGVSGSHNLSFVGSYTIYNPGTYTPDGANYVDATFTTTSATTSGTGGFVLAGNDSYTGATTIGSGASVIVSGSLSGTASVSVGANSSLSVTGLVNTAANLSLSGTLSGAGAVGAVTASSGSTIQPGGLNTGILSASSLNLQTGADFSIRLGGTAAGTGYDQLALTGGLTLAGTLQLSLINGFGSTIQSGEDFFLTDGATGASGGFSNVSAATGIALADGANGQIFSGGDEFAVFYDANGAGKTLNDGSDVALLVVAVPEPGCWQLCVGGIAAILFVARLRRRKVG